MFAYYTSRKAVAYTRVSTIGQEQSGIGLEMQRHAIEAYARRAGVEIIEWFTDAASARGDDNLETRSGLKAAIAAAKENEADLLVDRVDRLSRHADTVMKIVRDEKVMVICVSEGDTDDPLVMASRAAKAELEGDRISDLTKQGLKRKQASGTKLGNPTNLPEARRIAIRVVKERSEDKARELAVLISENGWHNLKVPDLVRALNEAGSKTRRNSKWTTASIRRPLARARNILRNDDNQEATDLNAYADDEKFGIF